MSKRASSLVVDLLWKLSPCNGWRRGSISTPWHTSSMNIAMVSLISLWRMCVYPPLGQCSAWAIVKSWPHGQVLGSFLGSIRYLKCNPSRNSALFRLKPHFVSGRTLGQFDAPFFEARLTISGFSSVSFLKVLSFSTFRLWALFRLISTEVSFCFCVASEMFNPLGVLRF